MFEVIRDHYPRWILRCTLVGVLIGNTIEAGADMGAMAAATNLFVSIPAPLIVVQRHSRSWPLDLGLLYTDSKYLRWLALVLLAYIGSALLAKPELGPVLRGTFIPTIHFKQEFLSILVAVIGTTVSAYLYTWQLNQEVEEEIAMGRKRLSQRKGATDDQLRQTRWDVLSGMFFSNVVMYFIILSTTSTLYKQVTKI